MRPLLFLMALTAAAQAQDASDYFSLPGSDYSACLVGHAVIVVQNQQIKEPFKALEIAQSVCKPGSLDTKTIDEVTAYAEGIVEDIAGK
jgi:hypothetical protein